MLTVPLSTYARIACDVFYSNVELQPEDPGAPAGTTNTLVPSLSYTFDNILWGLTGPVNGTRARAALTVVPPIEGLDAAFVAAEGDCRRYIHIARRFVIALRASAGASEPLSDNTAQRRYLLGGTQYWLNWQRDQQGYSQVMGNYNYSSMVVPFRGWSYFGLTGSRYALVNVEFRFPFVKELNIVWPLPIRLRYVNGVVFADAGNAWDPQDQMDNVPLPRDIYGGIGFGLRANLGIFVLKYDRAWRTDWLTYVDAPVNYWSLGADF